MNSTQQNIADAAGVSRAHIGHILNGIRRPSWRLAKTLAAITGTDPVLWLEGTPEDIRAALSKTSSDANAKG